MTAQQGHKTSHIDGLFAPTEAELIKRIPLARKACADELFWPFTQSGKYTSKSGYRFLKDAQDGLDGSEKQPVQIFWRKIWVLGVPNKMKNLVWRTCKDSIPTLVNLRRRSIAVSSRCARCSRKMKSDFLPCGHVGN